MKQKLHVIRQIYGNNGYQFLQAVNILPTLPDLYLKNAIINIDEKMSHIPRVIAQGAYADIISLGESRVLKAFRRKSYTALPVTEWADHDAITKAEFRAEAKAYENLANFPELKLYAPIYFGNVDPLDVLLELHDTKSLYVSGCGIIIEHIPGEAIKLAHLEESLKFKVEALLERFRDEVGMGYVWESSCFFPGTHADFTVIDFDTWDGYSKYQNELIKYGCLSATLRSQLERENAD